MRDHFSDAVIANAEYSRAEAEAALAAGTADAVAFSRPFLATPDLPARFATQKVCLDALLNTPDRTTFYGGRPAGYTDYPVWDGRPASTPPLQVHATLVAAPDTEDRVLVAVRDLVQSSRIKDDCRAYDLLRSQDDPAVLVLQET